MSDTRHVRLPSQLSLALRLHDAATLDNFWESPDNRLALRALRRTLERGGGLYLFGPEGSGRSHLLQAACHQCAAQGAIYLPLALLQELPPGSVLEDLAGLELVCLDDLDAVCGRPEWAEALFHTFNRAQLSGQTLLLSARSGPAALDCALPDLQSRLRGLECWRLPPLDEMQRLTALQWRARRRGLVLPDDVARFIIRRHARDTHALFALLDELDRRSLEAGRRLTIPFVRAVLQESQG